MERQQLIAFGTATNGEIYDPEYKGGEWMTRNVETHETLEQFEESSRQWAERRGSGSNGTGKSVKQIRCQ